MNSPNFYSALFRVTLPETALEVAALLVLVVDLGLLRKGGVESAAGCGRGAGRGWLRWRRLWPWNCRTLRG